tara:strand:- start:37 stop:195 length:159 start_codon:yes stop_codon:yes gene_type:complete
MMKDEKIPRSAVDPNQGNLIRPSKAGAILVRLTTEIKIIHEANNHDSATAVE